MTYMINRWRAKIDWKKVYNVRDPPRIEDRKGEAKKRKKKTVAICMTLETFVT